MPTYIEISQQFSDLIAKADYTTAHALLTKQAQMIHSADDLKRRAEGMKSYAPGPIGHVEVMEDFILEDWPAKQVGDVAIVYISLDGDDFCEGVSVTIAQQSDDFRIRDLEWGRP
jgi:hypothetical protein